MFELSFMIILLVTSLTMFDWLFVRKKLWKYVLYQLVPAHPCVLELHLPHHHLQAQHPARHCSYSRRWHGSVKKTREKSNNMIFFRCKRCSLEQRISRYANPGVDGQQWRRSWQCLHPPRVHPFEVFRKTLCLFFSSCFFLFSKNENTITCPLLYASPRVHPFKVFTKIVEEPSFRFHFHIDIWD